jgi:hypothetical protein
MGWMQYLYRNDTVFIPIYPLRGDYDFEKLVWRGEIQK